MSNNNSGIDLDNIPFVRVLSMFYGLLSLAIFIGSLGVCAYMLPGYWKRIATADNKREKAYFSMRFTAAWCVSYVGVVIIALAADAWFFSGDLINYWPTLSFIVMGWSMPHGTSVAMDVVWSLCLAVITTVVANWLGTESGTTYVEPDRVQAKNHIQDVMDRYRKVLASNPRNRADFQAMHPARRAKMLESYDERLEQMEHTVREVHRIWHKPCPLDEKR